jgi:cephalosporin-C deacetylase
MKNNCYRQLFFIFFFLPLALKAQLFVKPDLPTAKYRVGDTAFFIVQSDTNNVGTYSLKFGIGSDLPPIRSGAVNFNGGYAFIAYVAPTAGTVHCIVTQNGQTNFAGAVFEPFKIQPMEPEADGFDAFWTAQKAALATVPLSVNLQAKDTTGLAYKFNFNIGLTNGKRLYGYLNVPRGAGSYPAIIQMPAFGNIPNVIGDDPRLSERGGVISVILSVHDSLPTQNGVSNYLNIGVDNPANYYLKYVLLGVVKTIDYLKTRTDFNGQVGVIGLSQGGGLAILAAGIEPRISLLVNVNPAFCGHPNLKYGKPSGFPSYKTLAQSAGIEQNTVLNTVKYYDAATAAKRFKGVSWTMVAYRDDVCSASTVFEAFNQLKGQKILTHSIYRNHVETPDDYAIPEAPTGIYSFFRRHFPGTRQAPWIWTNTTLGYAIDAGRDTFLSQSNGLMLNGSLILENAAANLPVHWERIEGTGTVNFAQPNALTTWASFSQSGTYRLRLMAEDASKAATDERYMTLSDDILVTVNGIIPLELIDFKGIATEKGNDISWTTASERELKNFDLERSEDAQNWMSIAELSAKGNQNVNGQNDYQFLDEYPLSTSYYRLKMVDSNGSFKYSKTINLRSNIPTSVVLFPNPVTHFLTIKTSDFALPFDVRVYDVFGRLVIDSQSVSAILELNTNALINGNYYVEIKNKAGVFVRKIIKN